ncbi:MAG: hypothetical protein IPN11_07150 [Opitutaceae bacterium]|nr:hypothetical protein [Opitutaceae bacterium]
MNISILRKSLAIGTVLMAGLCSTAIGGSVLFEGDYAPQNWSTAFFNAGWLPLNSQTITPSSGDASTVTFGWDYGYYGNGGAGFGNTFTFFTTATGNDVLSFHWVDNAFAAWHMASQTAVAFYNDQFGYHSIDLGWNTSGDATMTVASGYTFGFSDHQRAVRPRPTAHPPARWSDVPQQRPDGGAPPRGPLGWPPVGVAAPPARARWNIIPVSRGPGSDLPNCR